MQQHIASAIVTRAGHAHTLQPAAKTAESPTSGPRVALPPLPASPRLKFAWTDVTCSRRTGKISGLYLQ